MQGGAQWQEFSALLSLTRGRSPSFAVALRSCLEMTVDCLKRPARMGWATHCELLRLEHACRQAGLFFSRQAGPAVPWRLPDHLLSLPASALPPHPLIDPPLLAAACTSATARACSAADALAWLLSDASAAARWGGLPMLSTSQHVPKARIAVCLHLYFVELWPEIRDHLAALPEPHDLIVTVPNFAATAQLAQIAVDCPNVLFVPTPNRGRDVLPWLRLLCSGVFDGYQYVCKLHGKKSTHADHGADWRRDTMAALLGTTANAAALVAALDASPAVGVLGPEATWVDASADRARAKNRRQLDGLAARLGLGSSAPLEPFFAGTMFWFRPNALQPLAGLNLQPIEFEPEMGQTDGTLAHAVERVLGLVAQQAGFRLAAWNPSASCLSARDHASQPEQPSLAGNR